MDSRAPVFTGKTRVGSNLNGRAEDLQRNRVNIRPGVSILSVLRHLNYEYWYALAEFVDNALQSYLSSENEIAKFQKEKEPLKVDIRVLDSDNAITVYDTAAGIPRAEFDRVFRTAALPPDRTGLSEFGMGMKSAACWCAREWSVRTSPLGDPHEYLVRFNIDEIVHSDIEELDVIVRPAMKSAHYTEVRLDGLHKLPVGRTIGKIRQHLGDIYREFARKQQLLLTFDGEPLVYEPPKILRAPFYKTPHNDPIDWKLPIDFDFGPDLRVHGFAAIREKASTARAGFSLFRRGRVIQGSGDEGYRPQKIFGRSNSFEYQRIFGELHLEGFEVSHTKDGFKWDENEEVFLDLLREELSKASMPLLQQARGHRVGDRPSGLEQAARVASDQTVDAIQRDAPPVIAELLEEVPNVVVPEELPRLANLTQRELSIEFPPWTWKITIEQTAADGAEWLEISDGPSRPDRNRTRSLGLRMSLMHPFMRNFAGADHEKIEPLLRVGIAIGLAEIIAREAGIEAQGGQHPRLGVIRKYVNELLRRALSQP